MIRAIKSVGPPAALPEIMRIGLPGYSCASADWVMSPKLAIAANISRKKVLTF
jgi:hypothetical protein